MLTLSALLAFCEKHSPISIELLKQMASDAEFW